MRSRGESHWKNLADFMTNKFPARRLAKTASLDSC